MATTRPMSTHTQGGRHVQNSLRSFKPLCGPAFAPSLPDMQSLPSCLHDSSSVSLLTWASSEQNGLLQPPLHLLKNAIASTKHLLIVAHPLVFELVMTFPSIYLTLPFIIVTRGDGDGGGVMRISQLSTKCLLCVMTCILFFTYSLYSWQHIRN